MGVWCEVVGWAWIGDGALGGFDERGISGGISMVGGLAGGWRTLVEQGRRGVSL